MIYIIKQYDFDTSENGPSLEEYMSIIGYTNTMEEAQKYISEMIDMHKTFNNFYKNSEGSIYPKYTYQPIDNLTIKVIENQEKKKGKNK